MTEPRVTLRGELAPPDGFDSLVSVGMGLSGPVAMWSSPEGQAALHERYEGQGGATFPNTQPSMSPQGTIAEYVGSVRPTNVVTMASLPVTFPYVQRFPDGTFLVVGARCEWSEKGPEQNALVVAEDGSVVRRGCVGDGLEHVQVAADGTIWTGYFDEGVFGNLGWGRPGPSPIGEPGIIAWSATFEKTWELDTPDYRNIADCYALNVAPDAVWACPYTDFPVIRIADGRADVFQTGVDRAGPRGIIASGERVALIGEYRDPSVLTVGQLTDGRWVEERRTHLWAPEGGPLPKAQVQCRGSVAHFFSGALWHAVDLDDLD